MRLYLIRHAQPEDGDYDDDPSITEAGHKATQALGQWMVDKDEVPTVLIVSPAVRTQETATCLADAIEAAGMMRPDIQTDVSIGPQMSIKAVVERVASDKSMVRVGIVSHHESLEHGLRVLGREPWIHLDIFSQGELRIVKIDRKDCDWKEHRRVMPSDLGFDDNY